ncbi:MAG: hypothetical protein FIB05_04415 [Betaproteobacteria bacterium]|nr:hypothetical protein [Betaproteobacteria bacterium]
MHSIKLTVIKTVLAGIWTSIAFSAGAQTYTVTDLGVSRAVKLFINAAGQVGGETMPTSSFYPQAFRYSYGLQLLGGLASVYGPDNSQGPASFIWGMNASGVVVGDSLVPYEDPMHPEWTNLTAFHGFVWTLMTGMRDIGSLGGPHTNVTGINNLGTVVGRSSNGITDRAFIWTEQDGIRDLGLPEGNSSAGKINNAGAIIGRYTTTTGESHGYVWTPTEGMRDLGTLGGTSTGPSAISDSGWIAGMSRSTDGTSRPFIWNSAGGMVEIPVPWTYDSCGVLGVNDYGQVLFNCATFVSPPYQQRFFVWRPDSGTFDLETLGTNVWVRAQNSSGVIVGSVGLPDGRRHAVVIDNGNLKDLNDLVSGAPAELADAWAISDSGLIAATTDRAATINPSAAVLLTPQPVAPPPGYTPLGTAIDLDLVATLPDGTTSFVALTFSEVTTTGQTAVTASDQGAPPPTGFKLGVPAVYYDVTTTATFNGSVTLCFGWTEGQYQNEAAIRLFHYEGGAWVDVTTSVDAVNNTACGTVTSLSPFALVETAFQFAGFYPPLSNPPATNTAKAGSAIPVKFSLGGYRGLDVFAVGYPRSQPIECSSLEPESSSVETVTAGASSLGYDATSDLYSYVWKTDKAWVGTCRQLVSRFTDGTEHRANFRFK